MEHAGAGLFHAIEQSGYALMIRDAVLVYPVANTLHVVAVLVFFASVAVMDLRVLGLISGEPVAAVIRRWRPMAIGALAVLALSGSVLFVPEAAAMARNASFQLKFALILIALVNVIAMSLAMRGFDSIRADASTLARASAALSLVLWLAVAACGRFIAYA